ncbi:conserved membrane protein of unknown function [Modestobacter italicus]|uniref:Uncharacterized protein n=1 Tax=Modestobacter italicus (strain DSM 44449 / CECT 9708 / BC 501) TaxID=2732864 RepID=I4F3J6_MODI5|nr:hypothetical protein [Modestobacter marinus]CCH90209.1 conserved membrane protein of unknown function [Modestobacter marinus]
MSEPVGRYREDDAPPHGSTGYTGAPLPGQPRTEQPTEVVPPTPTREDTVAYPSPRPVDDQRSEDPLDDIAEWEVDGAATEPDYRDTAVVVRRADTLAGLLLLLAGIAAGVSLLVVWVHGGATGLDLLRDGTDDLDTPQQLVDTGSWEVPAVVFGGAVLFVLGLLAYVPAKTHRLLGALALLVSLVVAAAVLVPLADLDWDLQRWAVGSWLAAAVAALGFLGGLKALSTSARLR